MIRVSVTMVFTLLLAGCATTPLPVPKEPFPVRSAPTAASEAPSMVEGAPPAPAPPPVTAADLTSPKAYAARFRRPETCEQAARNALDISRDRGWEVLRACVQKGGFTLIRRLLDGAWDLELQARADAAMLITQVVAARGGDVNGDLNLMRQRRIPLFSLAPAVENPPLYMGRLLLLRAVVTEIKVNRPKPTARLVEYSLGYTGHFTEVAAERYKGSASISGKGNYKGSSNSSRYGKRSGEGSFSGSANAYGQGEYGVERKFYDNKPVETGREAIARLAAADPFLEPGRQFIVLARFDGVREVPGEEEGEDARTMPVLSVIGYVEPNANVVE